MPKFSMNVYYDEIIAELRGIEVVNGGEKNIDFINLDVDMLADRLRENQEFIMAAKEYGFLEDDINSDPVQALADIYYDGDIDLVEGGSLAEMSIDGEECWEVATEALEECMKPHLEKMIKELVQWVEDNGGEILERTSHDVEFELDLGEWDNDHIPVYAGEVLDNASNLSSEIFYSFYEKHTHTLMYQLEITSECFEDVIW